MLLMFLFCCVTGHQIENIPRDDIEGWPYDLRFFINLWYAQCTEDQINEYHLDSDDFKKKMKMFYIRISYWYANVMDVSAEVFDMSSMVQTGRVACSRKNCAYDGCLVHQKAHSKHLYPADASILFGGYAVSGMPVVDQLVHGDIPPATIGKSEYNVSDNPLLKRMSKPVSIIFPLTESGRQVYFVDEACEKREVKLKFGQAVVFIGDAAHGGMTYTKKRGSSELYPAIHINMLSQLHGMKSEDPVVTMMPEYLLHLFPQEMGRLKVCDQTDAIEPLASKLLEALKSCLKDDGNCDLKDKMKKFHSDLGEVLEVDSLKRLKAANTKR